MLRQNIVELRDYTHYPGTRETLIDLFEHQFFEPQEAVGMSVLAAFRDVDRPDRFVWLRGFDDMPSRERALRAFYDEHPVWLAHRDAANATLIDSDNVLLLETAVVLAANGARNARYDLTICSFDSCIERELARSFPMPGTFTSAHYRNTYPRLPVHEDEHTFVWLTAERDGAMHEEALHGALEPFVQHVRNVAVRRLAPISVSRLQ
jgi:hypothetical protein